MKAGEQWEHRAVTRRMADPAFRAGQRAGLYDPHIAPINRLVDSLATAGRGWLPHVAPVHGGTHARLLWILRDPGPATADPELAERGFLCVENDDATAQRLCELLERAGIPVGDTIPWNAYPWYINKAPTSSQVAAGVGPLAELLGSLPELQVVLLLGNEAADAWKRLEASSPQLTSGLTVLRSRHTSRQAFIGTSEQAAVWREDQARTFEQAGEILSSNNASPAEPREVGATAGHRGTRLAAPRVFEDSDRAARLLRTYATAELSDGSGPFFPGSRFDSFGGLGDANLVSATDLLAVSMLSVDFPGSAVLRLLGRDAQDVTHLLAAIPQDVDLSDAGDEEIGRASAAWELWRLVDGLHRVGPVLTSKLLARKRPRLIPIQDSYVTTALGHREGDDFWARVRELLAESDLLPAIHAARTDAGLERRYTDLRVFDIVVWMDTYGESKLPAHLRAARVEQ